MENKYDFLLGSTSSSSVSTSVSGEQMSEQRVLRTVNFDRYEIEIELTTSGTFLGIISVKVKKSFIESFQNRNISDVHDVEEYYNEEE